MRKRCPNCGHDYSVYAEVKGGPQHGLVQLVCQLCGVAGPWRLSDEAAEEAWNALPRRETQDQTKLTGQT